MSTVFTKDMLVNIIILVLLPFQFIFAQQEADIQKVPKEALTPIYVLEKAYKDKNFGPLKKHTTGKFGDYVEKVDQYAFENSSGLPPSVAGFASRLKKMKIINSFMHDGNAYITVFWNLIVKSRHQTGGFYTQVYQITYLIKKDDRIWKIDNVKTTQEFAIYNK